LTYRYQACDDDYYAVGHDPSAQPHVQLDAVRRGQYDLGSEQVQPCHINDGMQMDKRRNVDLALVRAFLLAFEDVSTVDDQVMLVCCVINL